MIKSTMASINFYLIKPAGNITHNATFYTYAAEPFLQLSLELLLQCEGSVWTDQDHVM